MNLPTNKEHSEQELLKKRIKEQDANTENRYKEIFNFALDLICIIDIRTSSFIDVNLAFEDVLGYSKHELLKKTIFDFVHPYDIENTRKIFSEKIQKGKNLLIS